jgi:chloramphenicol-sensitive protein RarD
VGEPEASAPPSEAGASTATGARLAHRQANLGFAYALAAFVTWGLLPLYFHALRDVPAIQTLAHRIVWATIVLALILTLRGGWRDGLAAISRRDLRVFALTTVLLSTNWLVYIVAVNTGRVLEASLGYFVTPLVNVGLGIVVLGERLSRAQGLAIATAGVGVAVLVVGTGTAPWIPLLLALSFGTYGLLRKRLAVPPIMALFVETLAMLPVAGGYLMLVRADGTLAFGRGGPTDLLLLGTGLVTAFPLIWFAHAARRLRLSSLGAMQYISPTLGMLIAVTIFDEAFGPWHAVAFSTIWASLAIYGVDAARRARPHADVR